jgi:hypothetical protein
METAARLQREQKARQHEAAKQEAERQRVLEAVEAERARVAAEEQAKEDKDAMYARIKLRKEVIKARVLSRCVGTMKTNACSLRARNECALLIEAYKMPEAEYLAFKPVDFVEEVVSQSMRLTENEEATLNPKRRAYLAQLAAHSRSVKRDVRWVESCEGTLKEKIESRVRLGDDDTEYRKAMKRAEDDLETRAWTRPGRDQEGYWSGNAWSIELPDHSWREVPEWFADEAKPLFGKLGHLLVLAFALTLAVNAPVWLAALFMACLYGGKYNWERRRPSCDGERLDWLLAVHYRGLREVSLLGGD